MAPSGANETPLSRGDPLRKADAGSFEEVGCVCQESALGLDKVLNLVTFLPVPIIYFFDLELSVREFSAFLSHVIIDGFLRAGMFYSTTNSNPGKPFSRRRVFKYVKFNGMPDRRLAIFKYLSPGSGGDQLPGAVQWFLDEICGLLANFDFKQMCFPWKNPRLIDGELLQWEGYFFKPYYDIEESKRVRELLQKEGIFSYEVKSHEDIIGL